MPAANRRLAPALRQSPRRNGMPASRAPPWQRQDRATAASRCRPVSAAPRPSPVERRRRGQPWPTPDAAYPVAPSRRARHGMSPAPRRPDRRSRAARSLVLMRACSAWRRTARVSPPPSPPRHRARARLRRGQRSRSPCSSNAACRRWILQQRIGERRQFRLPFIAASDIGVADEPGTRCARCSASTVISPRLNGAPPPPVRPRTITRPDFGSAQHAVCRACVPDVPTVRDQRRACARQYRHPVGGVLRAVDPVGMASGMAGAWTCSDV